MCGYVSVYVCVSERVCVFVPLACACCVCVLTCVFVYGTVCRSVLDGLAMCARVLLAEPDKWIAIVDRQITLITLPGNNDY